MSTTNPAFARTDVDGLAVIGRTLHDLRGIRFGEGDGGNTPAAGAETGGEQLTDAQAQAILAQALAGGNNAGDPKPPWGDDPTKFDPDKAWKLIQNVKGDLETEKSKREQAIKDAVTQAQQSWTQQIGQALGITKVEETDPAKLNESITELTAKVSEKDAAIAAKDRTIAVLTNPAIRAANGPALLADKAFQDSIASVEPTNEAAITAAIAQRLQANPALKATPSRSGSGEHQGATVQSLETQLAAAQEKGDKTETIRLKMELAAARRRAKGA